MTHIHLTAREYINTSNIVYDLNNMDLEVQEKKLSSEGHYASLDWIIPTGISLIILKPYYETFLKKAAEDHYVMLKEFLKNKLYKEAINPKDEFKILNNKGVEKDTFFTMHFSMLHKLSKNNQHVTLKLMFPKNCSPEYFETSIKSFIELQNELEDELKSHELFDKLIHADKFSLSEKIVWYNEKINQLEYLDLVESSKNKSIVALKLQ